MSKDLIIIGSPRGKGSNSWFLAQIMIDGYQSVREWNPEVAFLSKKSELEAHINLFKSSERIFFHFPLYTDAMPGILKNFLDHLSRTDFKGKKLGYFIISGFPEAHHSLYIEEYFKNLTKKYKAELIGSIIKGGMEGVMIQPKWATKKIRKDIFQLGKELAEQGQFDPYLTKKMRKMMQLPKFAKLILPIFKMLGLTDMYWNKNLKKNNAFQNRFDRPYEA
jgi:NAD(P)H-dependent FMN reductase